MHLLLTVSATLAQQERIPGTLQSLTRIITNVHLMKYTHAYSRREYEVALTVSRTLQA